MQTRRRRSRVLSSRWAQSQAMVEGSLNHLEEDKPSEPIAAGRSPTERRLSGGSRTLPLYEAEEGARGR